MKILLVEDDDTLRGIMKMVLECDYEIFESDSMKDCREKLEKGLIPNLVLLDVKLPNGCGRDLLDTFLALKPQPVIIICSGHIDEADLAKPFTADELLSAVKTGLTEVQT